MAITFVIMNATVDFKKICFDLREMVLRVFSKFDFFFFKMEQVACFREIASTMK